MVVRATSIHERLLPDFPCSVRVRRSTPQSAFNSMIALTYHRVDIEGVARGPSRREDRPGASPASSMSANGAVLTTIVSRGFPGCPCVRSLAPRMLSSARENRVVWLNQTDSCTAAGLGGVST